MVAIWMRKALWLGGAALGRAGFGGLNLLPLSIIALAVLLAAWLVYDNMSLRGRLEGIDEASSRVEEVLKEAAPAIEDTDRTAIEEGEKHDDIAREAEKAVEAASRQDGAAGGCQPVPMRCLWPDRAGP